MGFTNGSLRVLDALCLDDTTGEPFRYARDAITHVAFSHDSCFLATVVSMLGEKKESRRWDVRKNVRREKEMML